MSKSAFIIVLGVIAIGVSLVVGGVFLVVHWFNQPLAERLNLPYAAPTPPPTVVAAVETSIPEGTCNNTGSTTFLFAGTGIAGNRNSADAIRVVKVDYDRAKITVVAVPYEVWVNSGDPNIGENRLGLIYHYKKQAGQGAERVRDQQATQLLADIFHKQWGVTVDHYLTVGVEPWGEMIDAIGGVEVNTTQEFTTTDGRIFPPGKHRMDGQTSKDFVRVLVSGDPERVQRQTLFAQALRQKFLSIHILPKVPVLYDKFEKVLITDFSPAQITDLACMIEKVPQSSISIHEIGEPLVSTRSDGALIPNHDKISMFLKIILAQD